VEANGSSIPSDVMGPGRRQIAPLPASIVLKDGKPWLSLGTPGYPPQPVTEVLISILEYGMDPKEAVEAVRFWQPSDNGKTVRIESRISEKVREGMATRGFKLVELTDYNWHTGSMQIIWRDDTGKLHGVTDPRRLGYAEGF
jgi:gamma-glutamyltranspeptidase/glutathione hydrolase